MKRLASSWGSVFVGVWTLLVSTSLSACEEDAPVIQSGRRERGGGSGAGDLGARGGTSGAGGGGGAKSDQGGRGGNVAGGFAGSGAAGNGASAGASGPGGASGAGASAPKCGEEPLVATSSLPKETLPSVVCTFSDGLGDFAARQRLDGARVVETGGKLSLALSLDNGADVRRYDVDVAGGKCAFVRDPSVKLPDDILRCVRPELDPVGGIWCPAVFTSQTSGIRRIWPKSSGTCPTDLALAPLLFAPDGKSFIDTHFQRFAYDDTACTPQAPPLCAPKFGSLGLAYDTLGRIHTVDSTSTSYVVDELGRKLFEYAEQLNAFDVRELSSCSTGICGLEGAPENAPLHILALRSAGDLTRRIAFEQPVTRGDYRLAAVGSRGFVFFIDSQGNFSATTPWRITARMVSGL